MPPEKSGSIISRQAMLESGNVVVMAFGFVALAAVFLLGISGITLTSKMIGFCAVALIYGIGFVTVNRKARKLTNSLLPEVTETVNAERVVGILTTDIEDQLFALEEANLFFSSSLKPSDMFRLVVSRIREIRPLSAAILLFRDESGSNLRIAQADGEN